MKQLAEPAMTAGFLSERDRSPPARRSRVIGITGENAQITNAAPAGHVRGPTPRPQHHRPHAQCSRKGKDIPHHGGASDSTSSSNSSCGILATRKVIRLGAAYGDAALGGVGRDADYRSPCGPGRGRDLSAAWKALRLSLPYFCLYRRRYKHAGFWLAPPPSATTPPDSSGFDLLGKIEQRIIVDLPRVARQRLALFAHDIHSSTRWHSAMARCAFS
jgi:hypothetical protein